MVYVFVFLAHWVGLLCNREPLKKVINANPQKYDTWDNYICWLGLNLRGQQTNTV